MKLKIAYDAKRLFNNNSGLGNYSRALVRDMLRCHPEDRFFLFTPRRKRTVDFLPSPNASVLTPRGIWYLLKGLWRLIHIAPKCQKEGIEIYHGLNHELPYGIEKTGLRTVLTIHDLIFLRHPEFYSRIDVKINNKKIRYASQIADVIVAVSQQTKNDVMELLGVPEEKIKVVYPVFSPAQNTLELTTAQVEEELKSFLIPSKFILCVGTMEPRKNQLKLLHALKNVPQAHLVIVGRNSGNYGQILQRYIKENDISDRVKMFGEVTERQLAAFYKKCLYVAYPSVYEGFGLPIVEAMSYGKAVLTTRGGCFAEAGGRGAWYADTSDVKDLSRCVRRLWDDAFLRSTLVAHGREHLRQFDPKYTTEKIYDIYDSLMMEKTLTEQEK